MFQCANILGLESEILLVSGKPHLVFPQRALMSFQTVITEVLWLFVCLCVRSAAHVYDVSIVNAGH